MSLPSPLVSVVIPTYNHGDFLGRCLQSVFGQSYLHWEAIVVDNHSQDNTDDVVQSYSDPRVKFLKIHNEGVIGASRNLGISVAQGAYVAFLDSDDWWEPTKLQRSVDALESGADLVFHDLFVVRSRKQTEFKSKVTSVQPSSPVFLALLCSGVSIPNSSVVVRKELLSKIGGISENIDLVAVEDYDTWIRISRVSERFIQLPECLGYYWIGGGNMSAASPKQIARIKTLYAQYLDELSEADRKKAEGFLAYRVGRLAQMHGDSVAAVESLKIALFCPIDFTYRAKALYFLARIRLSRAFS